MKSCTLGDKYEQPCCHFFLIKALLRESLEVSLQLYLLLSTTLASSTSLLPVSRNHHHLEKKMASSSVSENCVLINGDVDSSGGSEVSEMNSSSGFLMSLLEETQSEDYDNERLSSLIQSLGAEIGPKRMDGGDASMEPMMDPNICQTCDAGQVEGHDCWGADLISWNIDMEMDSPTSSSDHDDHDISFWYPIGDQMDAMTEFGGLRNCSQIYSGVDFDNGNIDLWQEPCEETMYS
ncbi:hypothetical protein NC651_003803 [Populus alba x Populus x berolinensis]|nr:hypothetical protein NC651_003803 [Populus alba x Populus x berolinensis]